MNLKDYGYIGEQAGTVARITSVHRDRYGIAGDFGEGYARLKAGEYYAGEEIFPTAGDFVRIDYIENGDSRILATLPRKTVFTRRDPGPIPREQAVAANFDYVFILQSLNHNFNPKRLERYLTEWGTLYSKAELEDLSSACRDCGLPLFLDGARLGYGLMAKQNDLTMADLARLCDVFYIGGTKVGALFGEAVVISNPVLARDFRYIMKQRGGMLAKGRLLGVQFDTLFTDDLYFHISDHADRLAEQLRAKFQALGYDFFMPAQSNQLFPILPASVRAYLAEKYTFIEMDRLDESLTVCRFCTSWATKQENVDALCADLEKISE